MNAVLLRRLTNDGTDSTPPRQLMQLMGIGETTATAIVAMVGNASEFTCGRQFAAWIGLVPGHTALEERRAWGASPRLETLACAACW